MKRLQKYISECGIASRRKAEELITSGKVSVNGEVVTTLGTKINETDVVMVNNKLIKEDLKEYFAEFRKYEPYCRFQGCMHLSEPDCGVKEALAEGKISPLRYENYKLLYEELKDVKKY